MPVTVVRVLGSDDWRDWRALRLAALTDAPEAFGSALSEWQGRGDTEARWRERLDAVPYNVLAELLGEHLGMVSGTAPDADRAVELISMWVAPSARGREVGSALVDSVVGWAQRQGAERVALTVVIGNTHAERLYLRSGFVPTGRLVPGPRGPERELTRELGARW